MLIKLVEEYMKWGLQINFGKTEYLTLDPGAGLKQDKSKPSTNSNTWDPFWKPPVQPL
jgi:hypothetical protein